MGFLWNNLWSVCPYIMGLFSGWWTPGGNDQQYLAAPIWKCMSGIGDHRSTCFMDLLPNYTFYTNLPNIVHWVVAWRKRGTLDNVKFRKNWEKYTKSFDAGLISKPLILINTSNFATTKTAGSFTNDQESRHCLLDQCFSHQTPDILVLIGICFTHKWNSLARSCRQLLA